MAKPLDSTPTIISNYGIFCLIKDTNTCCTQGHIKMAPPWRPERCLLEVRKCINLYQTGTPHDANTFFLMMVK